MSWSPTPLLLRSVALAAAALVALFAAGSARADHEPVIVIRGNPYVPVIIDGIDASGAVIFGERGLDRPGAAKAFEPGPLPPLPALVWRPRPYLPGDATRPRLGRLEIEPPAGRRLPRPAASFYRSWGTESAAGLVGTYPPYEPPSIIFAPPQRGGERPRPWP